jgi:hypothetical protein
MATFDVTIYQEWGGRKITISVENSRSGITNMGDWPGRPFPETTVV